MKVSDAVKIFEDNRVPPWMYTVGGLGNGECEGIDYLEGKWNVYYSERGQKSSQKSFEDESSAVECFIERVGRYLQLTEGRQIVRPV